MYAHVYCIYTKSTLNMHIYVFRYLNSMRKLLFYDLFLNSRASEKRSMRYVWVSGKTIELKKSRSLASAFLLIENLKFLFFVSTFKYTSEFSFLF